MAQREHTVIPSYEVQEEGTPFLPEQWSRYLQGRVIDCEGTRGRLWGVQRMLCIFI